MITRAARQIFSAYRVADYSDPDSFATQVAMVLEEYPDDVVKIVSDPRTGIQRQCKFPPSIAELVEFCNIEKTRMARVEDASKLILKPVVYRSTDPCNLLIPPNHRGYDQMRAAHAAGLLKHYREEFAGIYVSYHEYGDTVGYQRRID